MGRKDIIKHMKYNRNLLMLILLSLVIYIYSNGEHSIPIFVWIYPMLFLYMIDLYHSQKICLIIFGIYSVGFVIQFVNVIGMSFWLCAVAALLSAGRHLYLIFCGTNDIRLFKLKNISIFIAL